MKVIRVDIDETICTTPDEPRQYEKAVPIKKNIEKINELYREGHTIVYWTARGSRSGKDWHELTTEQLNRWGALHHELYCTKPYYDLLICDKTLRIEEL